ncbi:MAG: NAD(P)/FAD-dependent oxidoreductase [Verrucomicrobiaceae bacterium]
MTDAEHFDFAILGGGSAGYAAARTAVGLGLKTVVIDGAKELGGLCILRGCMPSKTLIESANRQLAVRHAGEFGLRVRSEMPDTVSIRDRKQRLIAEFADYRRGQLEDGRFTLLRGMGRFEDAKDKLLRIAVKMPDDSAQQITSDAALIATGSTISVPSLPGLNECGFWTSDTILDAAEIPDSFIVLGGGAIALEMAHFLDGIERKVTVLQRNTQLLTGTDPDVADVVRHAFEKRGITVKCGTTLQHIEKTATGKRVVFLQDGQTHTVEASEILLALGRRPSLEHLGLNTVGIDHANGPIKVAPTQQTSHPSIFAAGDVCGPLEVVHLAIQQGEIAAKNVASLLRGEKAELKMDYRCKLFGVFTQPEVASVGLSEAEARAQGLDFAVASYPFNDHGKSIVLGEVDGFVKLIADAKNGIILGGAVAGPHATELIHEIAVAMHLGATVAVLATAPHYHPTLSEIWTYPAEDLAEIINK